MERSTSTPSPLEAAAGEAGPRAIDAFAVLGDETRLSILLALWEAFEPWAAENAVSFSELRERLGRPDSGQFNYHLDKLDGRFVRKTDDGYELRRSGHQIVQTVIAGAGIEDPSLDPTEIEPVCYQCGAPTVVTYHDQWLFWACTECDGTFSYEALGSSISDDGPWGPLAAGAFAPAGFIDRSPEEMLNAAWTGSLLHFALGGVCDVCSGPMDGWLHLCDDHTPEEICPNCGWQEAVVARFRCAICKHHHQMVPWWLVINHPAVIAFYYDRGVPLLYEDGIRFQPRIESNLQANHDQQLVSKNPPRVRVTVQHEDDELQLTLDETLNVVEVRERN